MVATEVRVVLPRPHAKQQAILRDPAKRKVICAGRRAGKTTLAAAVAVEKLLEGRRVLLSSTTQEQADSFWDKAKAWLVDLIDAGLVQKNESRRILTFPRTGGRVKVKTAWDADSLRGDYCDFLVLDECALLSPDAWEKVGAPMLLDNDGDAWFISTPRRRNWFFKLYQKAAADGERWKSWHFTSYDNPYLSQPALAEITSDMPDEDIRQEVLAEFLEGEGAVFRNIAANLTAPLDTTPEQHVTRSGTTEQRHALYMGVDWGQRSDYTCCSVLCRDCQQEVAFDRFNKIGWAIQRDRIKALAERWHVDQILVESNSIGSPNLEALRDENLPVSGFETTAVSKPPLIKALVLAFERQEYQWLSIPAATAELEAYEAIVSPATGHTRYSAPDGMHDDSVIARAIAREAVERGSVFISFV